MHILQMVLTACFLTGFSKVPKVNSLQDEQELS